MSAVVVYPTDRKLSSGVNTTGEPFFNIINKGSLSEPGTCENMVFRAIMGQMSECPRYGILMVWVCFLSWIVFDHLMITVAPECEKMTSPPCHVSSIIILFAGVGQQIGKA